MRQEDLHRYIANEGKASHNRQSHQVRVLTLHANGIENGNDRKRPKQTHTPHIDGKNILIKEE